MGKQKRWDMQECALLLEAYLRVCDGAPRAATVSQLSKQLRQKAQNEGLTINDTFRNENGVGLQMSNLEYAFTSGAKGVPCKTKAFLEIVEIYRNDIEQYKAVLSDAKRKIDGENPNHMAVESTSCSDKQPEADWLIGQIEQRSIAYVDRRESGGCLWIIGSSELLPFVLECKAKGIVFNRKFSGSRATKGKAGWWTKYSFSSTDSLKSVAENKTDKQVIQCVKSHFPYGITAGSPIDMARLSSYYRSDFGSDHRLDDAMLASTLSSVCFQFDGKFYVIDNDTKQRIQTILETAFEQGNIIIFFEELYGMHESWFFGQGVISWEMLRELSASLLGRRLGKKQYILAPGCSGTEAESIAENILNVWGDQALRTFDELKELLPYIPMGKIKFSLASRRQFVRNAIGTYTTTAVFQISEHQIYEIVDYAETACEENGACNFDDLPIEQVKEENPDLSDAAITELLFMKFPNSFLLTGKMLSKSNQEVDVFQRVVDYCRERAECSFDELNQVVFELTGEMRYPTVVEAANLAMVRISRDLFVCDDQVDFDIEGIDACLKSIVGDDIVGTKEITTFASFPSCGYPWNHFLLESFCRRFSKQYRYLSNTPNSLNCGVVASRNFSGGFHEALATRLSRASIKLEESDAYDFLLSAGLIARRRYSRINEVLVEAQLLRGDD